MGTRKGGNSVVQNTGRQNLTQLGRMKYEAHSKKLSTLKSFRTQQKIQRKHWEISSEIHLYYDKRMLLHYIKHLKVIFLVYLKPFGLLVYLDRFWCTPSWPWTRYVVEDNLELLTFTSPPPKCWDSRSSPPFQCWNVLDKIMSKDCLLA